MDLLRRCGGYAVNPPRESLASAPPRPNYPAEDKSHNLRVDVVDPILTLLTQEITQQLHVPDPSPCERVGSQH